MGARGERRREGKKKLSLEIRTQAQVHIANSGKRRSKQSPRGPEQGCRSLRTAPECRHARTSTAPRETDWSHAQFAVVAIY